MNAPTSAVLRVLSFGYRDRGGALQQARATTSVAWCMAVGVLAALYMNPLVVCAVIAATLVVAINCRVLKIVLAAVAIAAPIGLLIALINPIASQEGVTVLVAGIQLPLIGTFDITQEAVVYGMIIGLRSVAVFAVSALYVGTVDPDALLRLLRRFSVRSAITASLAVRFVPVLARDGMNIALARECRPGEPPSTTAVVRSVFARSLERAGDAALALETRGYALARPVKTPPPRRLTADWIVLLSAFAVAAIAIAGAAAGFASFEAYPLTRIEAGGEDLAFAFAIFAAASLPVFVRRKENQP